MEFTKNFENNKKWVANKLSLDPQYFENLSRGQNPELLYIGCSDSRVTAEELMGVQPDEVFVHRNIANMVISIDLNDLDILNPWLRNIRDVYRLHKKELDNFKDENARYNRLIELNVQEAHKERGLLVYGWVFDVHSGELIDLKIDFPKILSEIMEIYRII